MPESTPRLFIELFGGLRVRQEGCAPIEIPAQQSGALLALLALDLRRNRTREEIIEQLWPEEEPERARQRLRHGLHALRRQFEGPPFERADLLLTTRTTVRLNPALVGTDVAAFEEALRAAARTTDLPERARLLDCTIGLYRGPLLPGLGQDGFVREQDRLAVLLENALHALTDAYAQMGMPDRAVECARRAISLDPLKEEAHCALMRLHAAMGRPSAVLKQYQELERVLKEELREEPSQSTRLLMESLRRTAQANAASHANGLPVAVPAASKEEKSPVAAGALPPIGPASAPAQAAPVPRRRFLPALAILSVGLGGWLAWQALGGHRSVLFPSHPCRCPVRRSGPEGPSLSIVP